MPRPSRRITPKSASSQTVVSTSHLAQLLRHEELTWREVRSARKDVGAYFQTLRQALKLEAEDVARSVGVRTYALLKVERGEQWSEIVVRRLADFYAFRTAEIAKSNRQP